MPLQVASSVLSVTPERSSDVAPSPPMPWRLANTGAAARPRAGSATPPRAYTASPLSAIGRGLSELALAARPRMETVLRPADRCVFKSDLDLENPIRDRHANCIQAAFSWQLKATIMESLMVIWSTPVKLYLER